jgi:hypothetical protein
MTNGFIETILPQSMRMSQGVDSSCNGRMTLRRSVAASLWAVVVVSRDEIDQNVRCGHCENFLLFR